VEQRGNAPRASILQGSTAPLCLPLWCPDVVSSHALLRFRQALSPDQLSGRSGADAGNRNRAFGVALRNSTFELHPHGGKWRESNLLPQRDGVYGAATAPAVLNGTSRRFAARVRRRELAEGEGVEPSTFPLAQFSRLVARHERHLPDLARSFPKTAAHPRIKSGAGFFGIAPVGRRGVNSNTRPSRSGTECSGSG
jgi:hypothetical protein